MLCGLTHPTGGRATVAGIDVWKDRHLVRTKVRLRCALSVFIRFDCRENLRFFGGACRVPPAELENKLRVCSGLADSKTNVTRPPEVCPEECGSCSRSVAALVHDPPLLFLDEPTSGLDPVPSPANLELALRSEATRERPIFRDERITWTKRALHRKSAFSNGRLLAKASPRALKASFRAKLAPSFDIEPIMPGVGSLCENLPEVLVFLAQWRLRIYAPRSRKLLANWRAHSAVPDLNLLGERWVEPEHGRCLYRLLTRLRRRFWKRSTS